MLKRVKNLATVYLQTVLPAIFLLSAFLISTPVYAAAVPSLTITEVLAYPTESATSTRNVFEFMEVKNNTSSAINLAGYTVKMWRSSGTKVWDLTADKSIPAGGVMVIWIYTMEAQGKTLADFNAHYGVNLTDSQMYIVDVSTNGAGYGLENTGYRKLTLAKDTGEEVCIAKYNDGTGDDVNANIDTPRDKSIVYEFPLYRVDGNITMRKLASGQKPTPGTVYTAANAPGIWITEMLPNPSFVSGDGSDAYEYIELYNNTASSINLSGYKFVRNSTTWDLATSFTLPAKGYAVVWVYNTYSQGLTLADFNAHYGTNLSSSQVYLLNLGSAGGLLNEASTQTIKLLTDAGTEICRAIYNDGGAPADSSYQDRSILYEYPVDGTKAMRKAAINQYPSPGTPYNQFFGQLHSHTSYSDGAKTPNDAYLWARDQGHADFFAVTDHSNAFDNPTDWTQSAEWADLKQKADYYNTDNSFTAIAGYEMTWNNIYGRWGHINTFNTEWFEIRENTAMDLYSYFNKLAADPASLSQFNHPDITGYGNFDEYKKWSREADELTPLMEVSNDAHYRNYIMALDKGWHVAPARNSDNHIVDWITRNGDRTVVLAARQTRDQIYDAIRERRVYASAGDSNLRIMYSINGNIMGSRLTGQTTLNVKADIYNQSGDNISKVSVISNGGTVVASQTYNTNKLTFTAALQPQYKYYFIRVDQADGDWAITAPVWIEDAVPVSVSMDVKATTAVTVPVQVYARVANSGSTTLSNVLVEFYKDSVTSINKLGESTIASIAAGGTGTASYSWSPPSGNYSLVAKVTTLVGGTTRTVLGNILVPELLITEMAANSANGPGTSTDFYEYVEIYNNSKNSINLKNYKIRVAFATGDDVYDYDIGSDFVIPAKSTGVVWLKNADNAAATLADFNANYGSTLTSSQLYSVEGFLPNAAGTRVVYIMTDAGAYISMARYNDGLDLNLDAKVENSSIVFAYPVDGTNLMRKTAGNQTATPGTVLVNQVPN